jgi:hypothetical protein
MPAGIFDMGRKTGFHLRQGYGEQAGLQALGFGREKSKVQGQPNRAWDIWDE